MPVALAAQLREGTKKSHTMAENTGFVSCFLKGVVDKASYRKLVADLYFVYGAMEEEIARLKDHPVVAPIAFPQLNRREALEQDLAFYFGADWKNQIQPSPSAAAYVASQFAQIGLKPLGNAGSYAQPVPLKTARLAATPPTLTLCQGERCVPETLLAIQELQDPYWGCEALLLVRGFLWRWPAISDSAQPKPRRRFCLPVWAWQAPTWALAVCCRA